MRRAGLIAALQRGELAGTVDGAGCGRGGSDPDPGREALLACRGGAPGDR